MFQNLTANIQVNTKKSFDQMTTNASNSKSNDKFNQLLGQAVNAQVTTQTPTTSAETNSAVEVIQAENVKEVLQLLGAEVDETGLFVQLEGEIIAMDKMLTLENIANLLSMDVEDLQSLLAQFGLVDENAQDIWAIIAQAPQILEQVVTFVDNGEATQDEALQVLQFFKVVEQIAKSQDTVMSQEAQLFQLQNALSQSTPIVLMNSNQGQTFNTIVSTIPVEAKVETNPSSNTNTQNESMFSQQQASQTGRMHSVTLPTNPASQSEALAKEIANLVKNSQLSNNQGTIRMTLKLFPENLGQIRIEIMQQNGVLTARLLATSAAGKELLDSSLHQLKTAFVTQNIQMDRIDVAQALQETDRNFRDQGFFGHLFKQHQEEESNEEQNEDDEEPISFSELLSEEVQA